MTTSTVDQLVTEYLARLDAASAPLPADRRAELVEEIGGHIASARAAGAAADEAAVRTLLDRLGPPEVIVAAAMEDELGAAPPGGPAAPPPPAPVLARQGTGLELAAVLLLTLGSIVPVVGWLVGVVLLWSSTRWRVAEKVLGTLVVPFGPGGLLLAGAFLPMQSCSATVGGLGTLVVGGEAGPFAPGSAPTQSFQPGGVVETCTGWGLPSAVTLPLLLLAFVAPIVVAVVLYRRAQQRAAIEPPSPVRPSPWGGIEVAAVVLLAAGSFVVPVVGSAVGLVLAWSSPRWTSREKTVATLLCVVPLMLLVLLTVLPLGGLLMARSA